MPPAATDLDLRLDCGRGLKPKYGPKLDARNLDAQYLKDISSKDRVRTDIYQGQFYNKEFAFPLNVVVILKTNLQTHAQAYVILFSTDLEQAHDQIIKFYSLHFQIEFNFRVSDELIIIDHNRCHTALSVVREWRVRQGRLHRTASPAALGSPPVNATVGWMS